MRRENISRPPLTMNNIIIYKNCVSISASLGHTHLLQHRIAPPLGVRFTLWETLHYADGSLLLLEETAQTHSNSTFGAENARVNYDENATC